MDASAITKLLVQKQESHQLRTLHAVDNYADCVDAGAMSSVLTPTAAAAIIVVDEFGAGTLTDISRVTGKALSTVQRAVHMLTRSGVLAREWSRGPFTFAPGAPRAPLRELANWTLGPREASRISAAAKNTDRADDPSVPRTITNPRIRRAWPHAIRRIVSTYHPKSVLLFGSQARGDADADSDVDLLVVFDEMSDRRERRVELRRLLVDMPFAKDVLVASAADLSHPLAGSALAEAVRDGIVVYER